LSGTRERPVFSSSRRPPPAAIASAPPPKAALPPPKPARIERPQLSLVGTIAGEGASFGIFVDQTTKAALRLKLGEDYQGWKLRAVNAREVTLQLDQQTAVLTLPQPGTEMPSQFQAKVETAAAPRPPESVQREPRR
jgi:general secretion pathway protein N